MGELVRELGIVVGVYTLRARSDGKVVLVHPDLPLDGSVSAVCASKDAAIAEAKRLTALGSPCVIVNPTPGTSRRQELVADDGADRPRRRSR